MQQENESLQPTTNSITVRSVLKILVFGVLLALMLVGAGILLGTFTAYEKADLTLSVFDLLKTHIREDLPVAVTAEIGHGTDARAVYIGRKYELYGCRDTAVF